MFMSAEDRFPSPQLGLGEGEYATLEELEAARKAIYWARSHWDPDNPDRFPSPKLGTGPGEYATMEELEAARKAIAWARQTGMAQMGFDRMGWENGHGGEFGNMFAGMSDADFEGSFISFQDLRDRFPSPEFGVGPGQYSTLEELEEARKRNDWLRQQYLAQAQTAARFHKIQVTAGP